MSEEAPNIPCDNMSVLFLELLGGCPIISSGMAGRQGRKSVDYSQKWGFMRGFMGHAIVILE